MSGHTDTSVAIDADVDLVWDVTNDIEGWPDLFTEYADARILRRHGDTVRFRLTTRPDADGNVWTWVSERTADRRRWQVRGRRVETGWFRYMSLHWTYVPLGGRTRLRWVQDFAMKPDAPLDDAAMTARITANSRAQLDVIADRIAAMARAGLRPATARQDPLAGLPPATETEEL